MRDRYERITRCDYYGIRVNGYIEETTDFLDEATEWLEEMLEDDMFGGETGIYELLDMSCCIIDWSYGSGIIDDTLADVIETYQLVNGIKVK